MLGAAKFPRKPFRKSVILTGCSVTDGARFLCASTGPASPPDPALQNKSLLLSSRGGLLCMPCCPAPSHFGWDVHKPPSLLCSLLISGCFQFESSPFLCTHWVEGRGFGNSLYSWPMWACRWYLLVMLHTQPNSTLCGSGWFSLSFIMEYNPEHKKSTELLASTSCTGHTLLHKLPYIQGFPTDLTEGSKTYSFKFSHEHCSQFSSRCL